VVGRRWTALDGVGRLDGWTGNLLLGNQFCENILIKIEFFMLKTDNNGFEHYDKLPDGYRIASLEDFHFQGRKKIGMSYLIRWSDQEYYEPRTVTDDLTGAWLKPFIDEQRVFIKS